MTRAAARAARRLRRRTVAITLFIAFCAPGAFGPPGAHALEPCSAPDTGWCLARRIQGEVAEGEFAFRFGAPRDVDGDGHADLAGGTRFRRKPGTTLQNGHAGIWSGASGAAIRTWDGELDDGLFGHGVVLIPDLDGDGLADVVLAAPNARVDGMVRGVVVARSPKTSAELWRRAGEPMQNLGWDLALAGDQDGDGREDLFVGAPSLDVPRVYLLSGKTGAVLRTYAPSGTAETFGWYVARLGDLDGDGHDDLAVGAPLEGTAAGDPPGGAYALSAKTGKELYHWTGPNGFSGFGEMVASTGDLDGDGKSEIVVGAPRTNDQSRSKPGELFVYSSATGKELRHWTGTQPGELYGRMAWAIDVDGDRVDDLAMGAPWHGGDGTPREGKLEIRSGKSGDVLYTLTGDEADCWLGWHVRSAPDPDGRGRPALLVSSLRHPVHGMAGAGVLDLIVLRDAKDAAAQGTMTRDARRSDIK